MALRHEPLHFLVHSVVLTAALMWFPVVNRHPGLPQLSDPARMMYVFLQSVVPTVPAAFYTFADSVDLHVLRRGAAGVQHHRGQDQQLAGAIMKV